MYVKNKLFNILSFIISQNTKKRHASSCNTVPVYSGMEAGEEMVDAFSQSLSPFCMAWRPGDISLDGE